MPQQQKQQQQQQHLPKHLLAAVQEKLSRFKRASNAMIKIEVL